MGKKPIVTSFVLIALVEVFMGLYVYKRRAVNVPVNPA